ncbi:MAG TPA: hypothetical protein VJO33_13300 [Gemmatimonadaceae bacterium]|nr:hypothetical protein [Gemmatimonadaceae bacterium]
MTDENRDRLDELLQDAALTYNRPPDERHMPLDEIWAGVEAQAFPATRTASRYSHWLRIAAALVIGVGIGRLSYVLGRAKPTPGTSASTITAPDSSPRISSTATAPTQPLDPATSRYLGQAAALLIALPTETNGARPDQAFMKRANELLLTTRLLIDSPSGADPALRNLLDDLELVLVQVVRLEKERDHSRSTEMELIQQALDQRDVIPRLRSAATEYSADD